MHASSSSSSFSFFCSNIPLLSLSLSRSQFQAERVVCRSWEERTGCVNGLATIQRKCGSLGQPMGAGVATRGWQRSLPRRPSLFFFFFFVRGSLLVLDHRIVSRSFYPLVRGCESWTWQARPSPSIRPLTLLLRWTGFSIFGCNGALLILAFWFFGSKLMESSPWIWCCLFYTINGLLINMNIDRIVEDVVINE